MTNERIRERDPRSDFDASTRRRAKRDQERPAPKRPDPNPWTREGADAPDAADIEAPDKQR
jgi:hypothetical protein